MIKLLPAFALLVACSGTSAATQPCTPSERSAQMQRMNQGNEPAYPGANPLMVDGEAALRGNFWVTKDSMSDVYSWFACVFNPRSIKKAPDGRSVSFVVGNGTQVLDVTLDSGGVNGAQTTMVFKPSSSWRYPR